MHRILAVLVLAALPGCQALGQALGQQPKADAPAYSGVGVLVVGSDNEARQIARGDQSGAVGASGQASQSATQTLEIPQEVVDALIGAAQQLIAAGHPEAAAGVLSAAQAALGGKKAPEPAKPPTAPPAPVPAPTPEAPK